MSLDSLLEETFSLLLDTKEKKIRIENDIRRFLKGLEILLGRFKEKGFGTVGFTFTLTDTGDRSVTLRISSAGVDYSISSRGDASREVFLAEMLNNNWDTFMSLLNKTLMEEKEVNKRFTGIEEGLNSKKGFQELVLLSGIIEARDK